jgi:hypothetical protein
VKPIAIAVLCALASLAPLAVADTIHVDASGGGDYLTIQEGIDAAGEGDVVLVAPGTYTGPNNRDLHFNGVNLTLESQSGVGSTIIDCEGEDRAFNFYYSGEDTTSVIRGFTIQNGYTDNYDGGGIRIRGAAVVVEDCLIKDCVASHNGGGLYTGYSLVGARVRNCVFQDNHATYRGGGAMVDHGSAAFHYCLFWRNSTDSGGETFYGGGGLLCNWVDYAGGHICHVSRTTFAENSSAGNGSGVHAHESPDGLWMTRSIVAFNEGPGLGTYSDPLVENLTFFNVYGNEGGDISPGYSTIVEGDPRFCGMLSGDFTLCSNSPCVPDGNIYGLLIGFADEGCGYCDSDVEESTWGRIKAIYR